MTLSHWESVISVSSAVPPSPALLTTRSSLAVPFLRQVEEGADLFLVGHVAGGAGDPVRPELLRQCPDGLVQTAGVAVAEDDAGVLLQEPACGGAADPRARGRGDHCGTACEQLVPGKVLRGLVHGCPPRDAVRRRAVPVPDSSTLLMAVG